MRAVALLLVCAAACGGVDAPLALDEPIVARGAQFVPGPLPGDPPDATATGEPRAITIVESTSSLLQLGDASKQVGGRTSTDAVAVGVALGDTGSGYWVAPVGAPDPTAGGEYQFGFDLAIGWDVPLGPSALALVAIDADGRAGRQRSVPVCIVPRVPDNAASCDASAAPPDTVIALTWDTDVDLDLLVMGDTTGATLDHDAGANCSHDGLRREDLVWQGAPEPGTYLVFARLADACGAGIVHFRATVYRADGPQLVEQRHVDGSMLANNADGSQGVGTFLLQVDL